MQDMNADLVPRLMLATGLSQVQVKKLLARRKSPHNRLIREAWVKALKEAGK